MENEHGTIFHELYAFHVTQLSFVTGKKVNVSYSPHPSTHNEI